MKSDEFMCVLCNRLGELGVGDTNTVYLYQLRLLGSWQISMMSSYKSVVVTLSPHPYGVLIPDLPARLVMRVDCETAWSWVHVERICGYILRVMARDADIRVTEYHKACENAEVLRWKQRMLFLSDAKFVNWFEPERNDYASEAERFCCGKFTLDRLMMDRSFTLDQAIRLADICREVMT